MKGDCRESERFRVIFPDRYKGRVCADFSFILKYPTARCRALCTDMARIPPQRLRPLRQEFEEVQNEEELLVAAVPAMEEDRRRKERKRWVKPWIEWRVLFGHYDNLMQELLRDSRGDFKNFLHMKPEMIHEMVDKLSPQLNKCDLHRPPLNPGLKLAMTLRFLATGELYRSLAFSLRVGHYTISKFIPEVCDAVVKEYGNKVFQTPSTPDQWCQVADSFGRRWDFITPEEPLMASTLPSASQGCPVPPSTTTRASTLLCLRDL